jgi:tryptophanase
VSACRLRVVGAGEELNTKRTDPHVEGGIRGCEIGTVMFGRHPDGTETPAAMDLVRLAIPRRTYTQSHVDYVIEVVRWVAERSGDLRGYRIAHEPPALRHFTARFEPLPTP